MFLIKPWSLLFLESVLQETSSFYLYNFLHFLYNLDNLNLNYNLLYVFVLFLDTSHTEKWLGIILKLEMYTFF